MEIQYHSLSSDDIEKNKKELITIMETILEDNITQHYPKGLAEQYVNKMSSYILDGSAIVIGAKYQDMLIGFSWAYELNIFNERRLHIDMIGVNAVYRRKGIAKSLVGMQIDEAKKRGIRIIEAMTTKANENSYHWFHSMGFVDERIKLMLDLENK